MSLDAWLITQGMKQVELAQRLGVHESVISRVVNEKRQPSAELWLAFARKFGVNTANEVLGENLPAEAEA